MPKSEATLPEYLPQAGDKVWWMGKLKKRYGRYCYPNKENAFKENAFMTFERGFCDDMPHLLFPVLHEDGSWWLHSEIALETQAARYYLRSDTFAGDLLCQKEIVQDPTKRGREEGRVLGLFYLALIRNTNGGTTITNISNLRPIDPAPLEEHPDGLR